MAVEVETAVEEIVTFLPDSTVVAAAGCVVNVTSLGTATPASVLSA